MVKSRDRDLDPLSMVHIFLNCIFLNTIYYKETKKYACPTTALVKAIIHGFASGKYGELFQFSEKRLVKELKHKYGENLESSPTVFNGCEISAKDRKSNNYYNLSIKVTECGFHKVLVKMKKSSFLATYDSYYKGPHCVCIDLISNGMQFLHIMEPLSHYSLVAIITKLILRMDLLQ